VTRARRTDHRRSGAVGVLTAMVMTACAPSATDPQVGRTREALIARGQYLATIMDCGGCHTPGALAGKPDGSRRLAGSDVGFRTATGVVYPPNLTPDPDTGLGRWSDADIMRAIREGRSRDGRVLSTVMPWPAYSVLRADDLRALVAFLRSLPPVRQATPRNAKAGETPPAPYLTIVAPK
jgi:mono/diheme cytochrome c family protein